MSSQPLLSFIVLSYNYDRYIGQTIRSILEQSVQDFEIVVVDDASSDGSLDVVRAFADERIRLLVNDRNLGGAASYNRAVEAACGEWLVNLDADDWIHPQKCERQLAFIADNPSVDIVCTYVAIVDAHGEQHVRAAELESLVNAMHPLDRVDCWIGSNPMCRSSTMVRRSTHLRIGLDDPAMVRAPDYELWTRALRLGARFATVPEKLTYYRLQSAGVTHGDPAGTLIELSFAMLKNLVPLAEARGLIPSIRRMTVWIARHQSLGTLSPAEAQSLLGMCMDSRVPDSFTAFRSMLSSQDPNSTLRHLGRRVQCLEDQADLTAVIAKLDSDIVAYIEARDFWHAQASKLQPWTKPQTIAMWMIRRFRLWRSKPTSSEANVGSK